MLTKTNDIIRDELKIIVESRLAMKATFIEAKLNQANFDLDNLSDIAFPVVLFVARPKSKVELSESLGRNRKTKMLLMVLNRVEGQDLDQVLINDQINLMSDLADNLMYWINRSSVSVNGGVDNYEVEPVDAKFDAHLIGVGLDFEWSTNTQDTGFNYNIR